MKHWTIKFLVTQETWSTGELNSWWL